MWVGKGFPHFGGAGAYTAFTLHKLNRSNRSAIVLGDSVNTFLPFCSIPFRSVPLNNGTVKFAIRKRSERSFSLIKHVKTLISTHYKYRWLLVGRTMRLSS